MNLPRECVVNFRHVSSKHKVYAVVRNNHYYSIPFYSATQKECKNCLVAFQYKEYIERKDDIVEMTVQDMKYVASLLKMPLIVALNSYCNLDDKEDHVDVYYYDKNLRN